MKFITGTDRNQLPLFALSIDEAIEPNNQIRLIDLFVDTSVLVFLLQKDFLKAFLTSFNFYNSYLFPEKKFFSVA